MVADTLGMPQRFIITADQVGDITTALTLLNGVQAKAVFADKAYDGMRYGSPSLEAVIPVEPLPQSRHPARYRHLQTQNRIELCFKEAQALPPLRHPIRPTNDLPHRLHTPRCRYNLAMLNVEPT